MAKRNKSLPLYSTIYADLRQEIFCGRLSPGDILPSESQLCSKYRVSRDTVRKALMALENENLVFSRPKIGYFVCKPNHSSLSLTLPEIMDSCEHRYKDIHGITADSVLAEKLCIAEGHIVIEFSQLSYSKDGLPVAFEIKYVPYEKAYPSVESEIRYAVFPDLTLSKITSFAVYTGMRISAITASPSIAEALECEAGDPLLLVEQTHTQQDGTPVGYSLQYIREPYNYLLGTSGHVQ